MRERIIELLHTAALLPEARTALERLITSDWLSEHLPRSGRGIPAIIECIYTALSGRSPDSIQSFLSAWLTAYAALIHLDHLQDDDQDNLIAATMPTQAAQYNLVFAYYALAMVLLDDLDPAHVPLERQLRLLHRWNRSMLTTASGQQRDLMGDVLEGSQPSLEYYAALIEAKAGDIYGLALGGAAILATDAPEPIAALTQIGTTYGVLLQWKDDLLDAPQQPTGSLTLPNRYSAACHEVAVALPSHSMGDYWHYLYRHYHTALCTTIASLPSVIQAAVLDLLTDTFGPVPGQA